MARKKDQTPPFEIMGKAPPRAPWHERAEPSDHAHAGPTPGSTEGMSPRQWKQWLTQTGPPLVLRVPRGVALAVVLGVLGLIVLAYWVGSERGQATAVERLAADASGPQGRMMRIPGRTPGGQEHANGPGGGAAAPVFVEDAPDDPRRPGLNYLVLATWNDADAQRLAGFLAEQGVATVLEPWNNTRLRVIAVDRGFEPGEVDERRAYRQRLLEIGRAWKRHNDGRGTALEDMHYDRYEG